MKKSGCLFLLLFITSIASAQVGIIAGYFQPDFSKLNAHVKTLGAEETFRPFYAIGINGEIGLNTGRKGSFVSAGSFELFLPQRLSINDSLHFRLNGWHLMTSLYGIRIITRDHFAVVAGPGIDWGSMNMRVTSETGKVHYNNPFIAPFARADVKFIFGKIGFGFRVSYRYEITKGLWKPEELNASALPDSKFSGLGLQAFVSYQY